MPPTRLAPVLAALALALAPLSAVAADDKGKAASTRQAEESAGAAEEEGGRVGDSGEPQKTLAERIPSVTRRAFVKQGRLEVFPTVALSLNDPFYDHVIGSMGLSYHVLESLAVGVVGDYYQSFASQVPVTDHVGAFNVDINRPLYAGRLELAWSPFYGKVSLFAENVLHFDFYVIGGGGMIARKRGNPTAEGVIGVGEHFFFNEWLGLRIELRDQLFMLGRNPDPTKENLQNLLTAVVGLSFFVPPSFQHEQL